ncbi:MAG: D-sedoheptulose 7-phosphate isomerase [Bacteroidaceae bacterium]|nr:D-sedoheptulose 7-phosphate isomerase [Bacteroidaceae bacterium]
MDIRETIIKSLDEARRTLEEFMSSPSALDQIEKAAQICVEALRNGNKIISCGNGGSLCDATHFAEELTGRYRDSRCPLPAIAINDPAYMTCVGNDFGFQNVFSRYVEGVGSKGDVLLAISTSGNSQNILDAVAKAQKKGMKVISLTSLGESKLSPLSDVAICTPRTAHSDRIQEIHIKVIHILIQCIEEMLPL